MTEHMFDTLNKVALSLRECLAAARDTSLERATVTACLEKTRSIQSALKLLQAELALNAAEADGAGDEGQSTLIAVAGLSKPESRRQADTYSGLAHLPIVAEKIESGHISFENATHLVEAARRVTPAAVEADDDLLDTATSLDADRMRRRVQRWIRDQEAQAEVDRQVELFENRSLKIWNHRDGSVRFYGMADRETGTRIRDALDGIANEFYVAEGGRDRPATEHRDIDQRRFDALEHLARGGGAGDDGAIGAPPAAVYVVALLRVDGELERPEIPSVGPIPQATLERITCNAEITGFLFDGRGQVLRHGRTVRRATPAQWRALIARDRGCVGCGASPRVCEAHHVVPFTDRPRTVIEEMALVCIRCHHLIHDRGWQLTWTDEIPGWEMLEPEPRQARRSAA